MLPWPSLVPLALIGAEVVDGHLYGSGADGVRGGHWTGVILVLGLIPGGVGASGPILLDDKFGSRRFDA